MKDIKFMDEVIELLSSKYIKEEKDKTMIDQITKDFFTNYQGGDHYQEYIKKYEVKKNEKTNS